jgi:hypothetical protein
MAESVAIIRHRITLRLRGLASGAGVLVSRPTSARELAAIAANLSLLPLDLVLELLPLDPAVELKLLVAQVLVQLSNAQVIAAPLIR